MFNIILVVVDCLRADHVSAYGYERQTTPNIDELAKNGVLFKRAYSQSTFTLTSAASILTGLYPEVHGVLRFRDKISSGSITLPNYLRRHGFDTTCFQGMNFFSRPWGLASIGFNEVNFLEREKAKKKGRQATCDEIYSEFSRYIQEVDTPFFSLIWFYDLHGEYGRFLMPGEKMAYLGKSENARLNGYDGELKYVDHYIGEIVAALNENRLIDDTLMIITSDHGDVFDEHYWFEGNQICDTIYKFPYFRKILSGNGYLGHLDVLPYEEVIHIPLIWKFPNNKYKGGIKAQVELIDIFPTILDLLNTKTTGMFLQGKSVISLLENDLNTRRIVYCCSKPRDSNALFACAKDEKFKFIRIYPPRINLENYRENPKLYIASRILGRERFFRSNASEKVDVSKQYPKHRHFLKKNLLQWRVENLRLRERVRIKSMIRRTKV